MATARSLFCETSATVTSSKEVRYAHLSPNARHRLGSDARNVYSSPSPVATVNTCPSMDHPKHVTSQFTLNSSASPVFSAKSPLLTSIIFTVLPL